MADQTYKDVNNTEDVNSVPNPNPLTDWKNEPQFKDLYQNYEDAQQDHSIILDKLEERKTNMDGGKVINAPKGKSRTRPRLIRKQAEWKYPALEEPFLNSQKMFEVNPRTFEDTESARQNELLLNYQWNVKIDRTELIGDTIRTIYDDGTVIVKTGWESEEEEVLVDKEVPVYADAQQSMQIIQQAVSSGSMSPEQAQQMLQSGQPVQTGTEIVQEYENVLIKNQPTYEVCDTRNVLLDPTANGRIEDLQFAIHEYDTTMSDLSKDEYKKETIINEETGEEEIIESGIYKNLKKINIESKSNTREYYNDTDNQESNFEFQDNPRKKLRAYEYWGYWDIDGDGNTEMIVATWVGKILIRMEKSPFPFSGLPFSFGKYLPRKNEMYGESDGDLLVENQESIGRMKRAANDITADIAVGQEFIDEQFFAGPSQKDNYRSGKTVYFRHGADPKTSIYKSKIEQVPKTVFDMIALENNDAESLTGTKAFSQGVGSQAFGSVAVGIRSALDATSKRELSILRRISSQLFKDMGAKTIMMNQAFLDEEEVIRITNKEYATIKRQDIAGEFDLIIDISTPEKDNEKAEKLNTMMQTNAASMHPGMSKIIYAKMAKLWNMYDLEEEVMNFEPEPDPLEDQLKQLKLENEMLKNKEIKMRIAKMAKDIESEDSKIMERDSRTAQNLDSESEENMANARYKNAQASKLETEKDAMDLDFIRTQDGTKRKESVEDQEMNHLSKMDYQEAEHNRQRENVTEKSLDKYDDFAMNQVAEENTANLEDSRAIDPNVPFTNGPATGSGN